MKLLLLRVKKVQSNVILRNLTLCIGNTLEINEDTYEMPFHQGLHC